MAAPTAPILGANCKFERNTGSYASPVWDEVPNVADIEPNWELTAAEVTSRVALNKQYEPALADFSLSITMPVYNPADADYQAFLAALTGRTSVDIACLDQASGTAGSQGPRAVCKVFKGARAEPLDGVTSISFDFKPCYGTNGISWMTTA